MNIFVQPEESSGEILPIEALESTVVQRGIDHWRALKGDRSFPARNEVAPRGLGPAVRHVILVKVLDDDYEYRLVGEALVAGFGENFAGKRLSAVIASDPKLGFGLKQLYDIVRHEGRPLGYRGQVGSDMRGASFAYHENAILPLGQAGVVDHLLIVSAITLRTALAL